MGSGTLQGFEQPVVTARALQPATWRVGVLSLLALLCAIVPSGAAGADAESFSLNWVRGEGAEKCASSQLLTRALEQHLGPVLRSGSDATLTIEGSITQSKPGHYETRTRVMTPQGDVLGERTFERSAQDCRALTPAILLVLTLTIDPSAAAHGFPTELLARLSTSEDPSAALLTELEKEPPKQAVSISAPPQKSSPPPVVAKLVSTKPEREWRVTLQAGPALSLALLPSDSLGATLGLGIESAKRLRLQLSGSYWLPTSTHFESLDGKEHAEIGALSTQLVACVPLLNRAPALLTGCAGGVLGARWVYDSTLEQPSKTRRPFGGPLAQLSFGYAFTERWFAQLDVAAALLVRRDRFVYDDIAGQAHTIFQPNVLAAFSSLSAGVRL